MAIKRTEVKKEIDVTSQLAESKLTKSEAIDIIIANMLDKLDAEIKIRDEIRERDFKVELGDLAQFVKAAYVGYACEEKEKVNFIMDTNVEYSKLTPKLRATVDAQMRNDKELRELHEQKNKIISERGRIKAKILSEILASTEEGRELLEQLKKIEITMDSKLLLPAKK